MPVLRQSYYTTIFNKSNIFAINEIKSSRDNKIREFFREELEIDFHGSTYKLKKIEITDFPVRIKDNTVIINDKFGFDLNLIIDVAVVLSILSGYPENYKKEIKFSKLDNYFNFYCLTDEVCPLFVVNCYCMNYFGVIAPKVFS